MIQKLKDSFRIILSFKNFNMLLFDYLGLIKNNIYNLKMRNGLNILIRAGTNDRSILKELFINKCYFNDKYKVKNGDIIFDIGANIGLFSLSIIKNFKNINIYAFEPESQNFALLVQQIKNNRISNIHSFNKAICASNGSVKLFKSKNTGGHSVIEQSEFVDRYKLNLENYETVESVSLEKFISDYKINKINFLKMDIEGGEYDILYNLNTHTLNLIDKIVMEYHYIDSNKNGDKLKEFLESKGYTVQLKYPLLFASKN